MTSLEFNQVVFDGRVLLGCHSLWVVAIDPFEREGKSRRVYAAKTSSPHLDMVTVDEGRAWSESVMAHFIGSAGLVLFDPETGELSIVSLMLRKVMCNAMTDLIAPRSDVFLTTSDTAIGIGCRANGIMAVGVEFKQAGDEWIGVFVPPEEVCEGDACIAQMHGEERMPEMCSLQYAENDVMLAGFDDGSVTCYGRKSPGKWIEREIAMFGDEFGLDSGAMVRVQIDGDTMLIVRSHELLIFPDWKNHDTPPVMVRAYDKRIVDEQFKDGTTPSFNDAVIAGDTIFAQMGDSTVRLVSSGDGKTVWQDSSRPRRQCLSMIPSRLTWDGAVAVMVDPSGSVTMYHTP
jgi:hypothetical protein